MASKGCTATHTMPAHHSHCWLLLVLAMVLFVHPHTLQPAHAWHGTACETDTDSDGWPDCVDGCPNDPAKTGPGACGCDVSDADTDGDGHLDFCGSGGIFQDRCPQDGNKPHPGYCGCGVADAAADDDYYGSSGGALQCCSWVGGEDDDDGDG